MFSGTSLLAQQNKSDSAIIARQRISDSTKKIQKQRMDSVAAQRKYKESKRYKDSVVNARNNAVNALRESRANHTDSITSERKRVQDSAVAQRKLTTQEVQQRLKARSDSLAAIRKHKESRKYQDSLAKSRNLRIDSMRNTRTHYFDSLKMIRQKSLDSAITARKKVTDSVRAKQKIKSDSLTVIRKYKESRRYRDSVQVTRQSRLDSIKAVRKIYSDNIVSTRKKVLDSLTKTRKIKLDSLTKARKIKSDSLKVVHDQRADSMAKKKELREKQAKADFKKKEEKMKLSLDLKIKKKHEAWSNEKMLKKKWTLLRQAFQNTYTHYNYYFNAKRKMQEAYANMNRRKKDNFEQRIELFPFDPNVDSTVFASDMDTIVRKASVGIQVHDPRTKWADDLYLLMGQAYYFKGDYERAATSFKYIIGMKNRNLTKKKKKPAKKEDAGDIAQKEKGRLARLFQHKPAHNDAILWLTRTDVSNQKQGEAEAILDLLDASSKLSENMKAKIALEKANLYVNKGAYREASKQLSAVVKAKNVSKYIRQRAAFLNGQLLYDMGQYDSAAANYTKNINLHPPIDMDFYARKNRAAALAEAGGDQSGSIASLKRLLKDGKYVPYYEQVYFILGKLSANENKTEDALANYYKSLQQPKTTKKQKAITFSAIGNIQYKSGQYNLAKKSYDSASYFAKGISGNEEIDLALRRGKMLDKIEEPYYLLQTQDSILRLAAMSEKEQKAVIKKHLRYLEKQKQDSVANAATAAASGSLAASAGSSGSSGPSNWYFGNSAAVQQGYNEFKRKWGNRSLADNWRRASASGFGSGAATDAAAEDSTDVEETNSAALTESALLAAIPKTEPQLNAIRKKLRRAYVDLGSAYIKELEEYKEGLASLDSLDNRFPSHEFPDEVLSLRYTAALRQGKMEEAEKIRLQLLNAYPNSNFSRALDTDTSGAAGNTKNISVAEYYETTYELANDRQYNEVISRTAVAKRIYGDLAYARKFRILEALSLAATGQYKKADTVLTDYIKENPSDSLRPWVDAILKNVNDQKAADTVKVDSGKISLITPAADSSTRMIKTGNDSLATAKPAIPAQYTYAAKENHYCIFIFGKPDSKIAGFRSGLSDFSTIKFNTLSIASTLDMLNANQSMVITKTFSNAAQAKTFMNTAKNEPLLFREMTKGSYQYFIISEHNFTRLKAEKKLADYLTFYNRYYK